MKNLDLLAAEAAQKIIAETSHILKASDVENLVTKTLGVLQENGVYACLLFVFSRSKVESGKTPTDEKKIAKVVQQNLLDVMNKALDKPASINANAAVALAFLTTNICADLDTLLLVKQVWEQTLIYARYGAKARS